jgi:hypothetical protein
MMAVEERTGIAVKRGLREAIAWRMAAEWFRRHPRDLWLRRASWSDQGEVLRAYVVTPTYQGHHADLPLEGRDAVRFYTSEWHFEMPGLWSMAVEQESPREILDHLCEDLGLDCVHPTLHPTTKRTLSYRVIAGLLASTQFEADLWQCQSVVAGSGSSGLVLREDLLGPFHQMAPSPPRSAYPPGALKEEAFGIWALTRNGEPQVCLTERGEAHFLDGRTLDYSSLFQQTRRPGKPGRIAPVVGAVGADILP